MNASMPALRRVYWETTAACNLRCIHCRRIDVLDRVSPEEMDTQQAKEMIDDLSAMGKPVLILSGGEPLYRPDVFELAAYASGSGLPVALSTNGTMVTPATAGEIKSAGIYYASISLDGVKAQTHEAFRGKGNFDRALWGFSNLRNAGIKVQINFTVTKRNAAELPEMYDLARSLKAHALYLFLLVPVGCGVRIADSQMLDPREVEEWLKWAHEKAKDRAMELRPICAPQYYRIAEEMEKAQGQPERDGKKRLGCLAGVNICFISHKGDVYPCGYLPVSAGNVKSGKLSEIWRDSSMFAQLRNYDLLEGKCGGCAYKISCGGCRARGYYQQGSILAEEPYCLHEPRRNKLSPI